MIRNLILASALTLGFVVSAYADSDNKTYPATSPSGEVIHSSNGQVVTIGGTLVEKESDRTERSRSAPAAAAPG